MSGQQNHYHNNTNNYNNRAPNFSQKIRTFYERELLFDVVLIAGIDNVKLKAHRIVLCASSDYFLKKFSSTPMDEEIKLKRIDGEILQLMLDYIYKGFVELRPETVTKLMSAALDFEIHSLQIFCAKFVADSRYLPRQNRSPMPSTSKRSRTTDVQRASYSPYNEEANLVFLSFESNSIKAQTFNPQRDKWTYKERSKPLQNRSEFGATVRNKKLIIAGGEINGSTVNTLECLDLQVDEWTTLPSMRFRRRCAAVTELNGKLYVMGGYCSGEWSPLVEKYDFSTHQWQTMQPLPRALIQVQVAALSGLLYAVGNNHPFLECYDPDTNNWTQKPFRSLRAERFCITALKGHLYAIGGFYNGEPSNAVERYNPSTNSWTFVRPLSHGRSDIRCAVLNNRLIACAGFKKVGRVNSVEEYDTETDEWKTLSPLFQYLESNFYGLFLL